MKKKSFLISLILFLSFHQLALDKAHASKFPGPWTKQGVIKTYDIPDNYHEEALWWPWKGDAQNFHVVGIIGDPFVVYDEDEDKYKIWFTATKEEPGKKPVLGTAYSESQDGLLWQDPKHRENGIDLVFEPTPGTWDQYAIETVAVLKKGGKYMMWYGGQPLPDPNAVMYIGLATSEDGIHWTKHPEPVLKPDERWNKTMKIGKRQYGGVVEPSVIFDEEENIFKMWYMGAGNKDGIWGERIGYATSKDGINWDLHPKPVFEPGPKKAWDREEVSQVNVIKDPNGGYHMFYVGEIGKGFAGIGHAYSNDGIHWERNPDNPILKKKEKKSWDRGLIGGPCAIIRDGEIHLYYMGSRKNNFVHVHFGVATAKLTR